MRTYQLWFPACSLKEAFLHQMNFFIFLNFFSRYHPQSKSQLFYTTGLCVDDVHIFHQPNKRKCFSLYGSFDPKSGVCTLNRSFNLNAAVHSNARRHFDIKKLIKIWRRLPCERQTIELLGWAAVFRSAPRRRGSRT